MYCKKLLLILVIPILLLYGQSEWAQHIIDDSFSTANFVFAIDLDGDNDVDVLCTSCYGNAIAWWENEGGILPSFTKHTLNDNFQDAYGVSTAISPELAFWIYATVYSMPSIYHEVRYKSLGVRLKSWWSKFQAKRKEKAVKKQDTKRKDREKLNAEVEELKNYLE